MMKDHRTISLSLTYRIKIKSPELLLRWGLKNTHKRRKFASNVNWRFVSFSRSACEHYALRERRGSRGFLIKAIPEAEDIICYVRSLTPSAPILIT